MANNEIKVPRLDWLIGGSRIGGTYNRYFGSLGTDPQKGCLCEKIFNYSIWIEKIKIEKDNDDNEEDEFEEIIKAAAYFGINSFDNTDQEQIETKSFDFEEESLPLVKQWLEEQYAKK